VNIIRGKRQHAEAERADGAGAGTLSRRGVLGGLAAVPALLIGPRLDGSMLEVGILDIESDDAVVIHAMALRPRFYRFLG
jgi:hypothetical protein